jgi:hypothetical protein
VVLLVATTQTMMESTLLSSPTEEDIKAYYETDSSPCEVVNDPSRLVECQGDCPIIFKALRATRALGTGETVFVEDPLVCMQSLSSCDTTLNCQECLGFIGESLVDQVHHFLSHRDVQLPSHGQGGDTGMDELKFIPSLCCGAPLVGCHRGCSLDFLGYYCSESCRDKAWNDHHQLMCPGKSSEKEWLVEFYQHARATNDIFILAAKTVSQVLLRAQDLLDSVSSSEEALLLAWRPYKVGYKKVWWDSVALPDDVPEEEEEDFRSDLKELASDSLELFRRAIELDHPRMYREFIALFDLDVWGSIIGMFELNNLSILGQGPILNPEEHGVMQGELLGDLSEEFEDVIVEGTGFYRLHSCMNHSCEPNCRAVLPRDNTEYNKAIIETIREVEAGEELTVSYIEENETYDERQKQLRDYGFTCTCAACMRDKVVTA